MKGGRKMEMGRVVGTVIGIAVGIIVISTVLAPTISDAIGTTSAPGALAEYSGLLGAVVVLTIVGILMLAVAMITRKV